MTFWKGSPKESGAAALDLRCPTMQLYLKGRLYVSSSLDRWDLVAQRTPIRCRSDVRVERLLAAGANPKTGLVKMWILHPTLLSNIIWGWSQTRIMKDILDLSTGGYLLVCFMPFILEKTKTVPLHGCFSVDAFEITPNLRYQKNT